ncbi:MAG: (Fe-S)-binding protein [Anaerolineales bacterium]|nr:(Fe-S)-binding protein [Anaerolineales bacterium]
MTCIVDSLFPQVGEAVVKVLERLGVEVEFPDAQTCCGQPAYNGGFTVEARQVALHFLDVFAPTVPDPIVVSSGSCAAMVVHACPDLFKDDPPNLLRAQAVANRTYEFTQFLVDVLGVTDVGAQFSGKLTYHASCHLLRFLHVIDQPLRLLANIRDARVTALPGAEECCGFGGLFAVKFGGVSGAILDKKIENIRAAGAGHVVGCDMSCLMHIQGGLSRDGVPVKCLHIAEVLARRAM